MLSKDICLKILLLSVSAVTVRSQGTVDFCEAFAENQNRIDYGYYDIMNHRFLIIGQNYWLLKGEWNEESLLLKLKSRLGQRNEELFQSQYKTSFDTRFCGYIGNQRICKRLSGFLKKDSESYSINWVPIDYDYDTDTLKKAKYLDLYNRQVLNETKIDFGNDFEPTIAFQFVGHYTCFAQQSTHRYIVDWNSSHSESEYSREFQCFRFDGNTGEAIDISRRVAESLLREIMKNETDIHLLHGIPDAKKLGAIFNDFHVLYDSKQITYCPSHSFFFTYGCKEEARVLIDCSGSSSSEGPSSSTESGSSSSSP